MAMMPGDSQEALEELWRFRPALHGEKVDDLNEQFRVATTCIAYRLDQFLQSGNGAIVTDAQEWPAGNVPHASSFDNESAGLPLSKSSIPIEVRFGYETFFGRAPRNHRRHPGSALKGQRPDANRLKQQRPCHLFRRGPMRFGNWVLDRIRKLPHCVGLTLSRSAFLECAGRAPAATNLWVFVEAMGILPKAKVVSQFHLPRHSR